MSRFYYFDEDKKKFVEGHPPCRIKKYGEAPYVITDSIDPYYHPAAEQWVDSKRSLKDCDKACGTFTSNKLESKGDGPKKERTKRRHEDLHRSMHKAIAQIDAGTAPMTEETRVMCERKNEIVSKALNFDAFNVAGRKNNVRGKAFRR